VPVYIFTGTHELAARRDPALAWFRRLQAPVKRLYDFRDAATRRPSSTSRTCIESRSTPCFPPRTRPERGREI
jgi:hypothetical protein